MSDVEARSRSNFELAKSEAKNPISCVVHKGLSHDALARFLGEEKTGYFDLIYIDGSHQALDVLADAVMTF